MSKEIMVSINCTTYNQESYIADAIESFLMQKTNFKYEILIHDDASTDNTRSIIKKYEKQYPDIIKPIYQEENKYSKGIKVNYEYNFKRSKGKYIALCEGDDYWTDPYKLQKQVDYMESNPECTLCMHMVEAVNADTKQSLRFIRPYNYNKICSTEEVMMGGGGFVGTNSLLFPKKAFKNAPEFYHNCPVGDYPLQILLTYKGYAYYMNENMSAYRVNSKNSWSRRMLNVSNEKKIQHIDKVEKMLDGFNIYSNREYENTINKLKKRNEFRRELIKGNLKELKQHKYKQFYLELGIKTKIKLFITYYLPISEKFIIYLRSKYRNA